MLIGRKNNSITWTVPSNNKTVEPYGEPHWSCSLGDAPILDFRVQVATKKDFKTTKAHWYVLPNLRCKILVIFWLLKTYTYILGPSD